MAGVVNAVRPHASARLAFENRNLIVVLQQISGRQTGDTRTDNG